MYFFASTIKWWELTISAFILRWEKTWCPIIRLKEWCAVINASKALCKTTVPVRKLVKHCITSLFKRSTDFRQVLEKDLARGTTFSEMEVNNTVD